MWFITIKPAGFLFDVALVWLVVINGWGVSISFDDDALAGLL